eukprot:7376338-Prymnesium_polylepis.2
MGTANRARHRLQWFAGMLCSKAATETCTREFERVHPCTRHISRESARTRAARVGRVAIHRIWETRDRILTEGCGRVSPSPEHNAVATRYR